MGLLDSMNQLLYFIHAISSQFNWEVMSLDVLPVRNASAIHSLNRVEQPEVYY